MSGAGTTGEAIDFEALCRLEPRLRELEEEVGAVRDGGGSFFCSNFVWLPLDGDLRALVGVARRGADPSGGAVLREGSSYEVAYRHLSSLMPPCRDCGCRRFAPYRLERVG